MDKKEFEFLLKQGEGQFTEFKESLSDEVIESLVVIVSALTSNQQTALQNELNNLTAQLNNDDYSWLVDYNISSGNVSEPKVQVFRREDNNLLAEFTNLTGSFDRHQIFLTNLSENESYDVFDLKSIGDVEGVPKEILMKKIRIDEIKREELK